MSLKCSSEDETSKLPKVSGKAESIFLISSGSETNVQAEMLIFT